MENTWDESKLKSLIANQIEENTNLDYKAAKSLTKLNKDEITKDVSSFANSAGGIIIYGMKENQENRHLPSEIDPVNRKEFSKEWLEHIIGNIKPPIKDIKIYPVTINTNPNYVVYVVDIPKGTRAHQATSKRYYRRYNFEAVAMDDYEIQDINNRLSYPVIDLEFIVKMESEIHLLPRLLSKLPRLKNSKKKIDSVRVLTVNNIRDDMS